ncbi:MAG: NAD(+) synthase [Candidatus Latescibacteria bacterium]|nr:NAD(+) synthase [Candidatus Latescibacterota bacterium]
MLHPWLAIDVEKEIDLICGVLRQTLMRFKRRGYVLGVSGGIDSSVTMALCCRAVGKERVFALQMPERHSARETETFGDLLISKFGVPFAAEPITEMLEAAGFYERYDATVRKQIPVYTNGWTSKIISSNVFDKKGFTIFSVVAQAASGEVIKKRLPAKEYLEIVAATNFKQRLRKMMEYYYADRMNYAVAGTPNRLEYDQGFFVKTGDGSADVKPIAHLYKSQVYELARHLEIPEEICSRPPTTDTYSMSQGQDEFYFSLPYGQMDLCLYGKNNGRSAESIAGETDLTVEQINLIFNDIDTKRSTTRYLHAPPVLVRQVNEIGE